MLEYLALGMLCLSVTAIFYIFIFIHDLPHRMAKKRNHPQQEAIHYACWLSLFTLHAIWPLVFLWSVSNRDPIRVSVDGEGGNGGEGGEGGDGRVAALERRIAELEAKASAGGEG
jgi:hypothetical protein